MGDNLPQTPNENLRSLFIEGMGSSAATVNVVTTDGAHGRAGLTVSAMSSVSADGDEPTLLVCINGSSSAAEALLANGVFCVNILRDDQSYISDTFAGRYKDRFADKFDCASWQSMGSGAPRVIDPLVAFDCRVVNVVKMGTHHVVFGAVGDVFTAPSGSPLIYHNRAYQSSRPIRPLPLPNTDETASQPHLALGSFHTFGPFLLPRIIRDLSEAHGGFSLDLIEGDNRSVLEALAAGRVELALLYEFATDDTFEKIILAQLEPYVLLAEGHELVEHAEVTPEMLADYPMIAAAEPVSHDVLRKPFTELGIEPQVVHAFSSFEMVRGLVGHGLGFAIVLTKPAMSITYDGKPLVSRKLAGASASNVVLAWHADRNLSSIAREFITQCEKIS